MVNKSQREILVSKFSVKRCTIRAVELFNDRMIYIFTENVWENCT